MKHYKWKQKKAHQKKQKSSHRVNSCNEIHEPLDALLQAYEARLKPLETMGKNYPNLAIESRQLEIYKRMIETLQSIEQHTK